MSAKAPDVRSDDADIDNTEAARGTTALSTSNVDRGETSEKRVDFGDRRYPYNVHRYLATSATTRASEHKHVYEPLAENQIRLLELLLAMRHHEIHIRISTVQNGDASNPTYEALSYVWGSTENRKRIWIEPSATEVLAETPKHATYLEVTQNLKL